MMEDANARAMRYRACVDEARDLTHLPSRQAIEGLLEMIAGYEDGITWMTTCLNCARLMNDNYAQYCTIEELRSRL